MRGPAMRNSQAAPLVYATATISLPPETSPDKLPTKLATMFVEMQIEHGFHRYGGDFVWDKDGSLKGYG